MDVPDDQGSMLLVLCPCFDKQFHPIRLHAAVGNSGLRRVGGKRRVPTVPVAVAVIRQTEMVLLEDVDHIRKPSRGAGRPANDAEFADKYPHAILLLEGDSAFHGRFKRRLVPKHRR